MEMDIFFRNNSEKNIEETYSKSKEYLASNKQYLEEINNHLMAFHDLLDLIPQTKENFWSGHVFPITEAGYELEASLHFCCEGFYKQAIYSLRNALELSILSVYWDLNDESHIDIQSWLHSLENTPFRENIRKSLLSNNNIKKYNSDIGIIFRYDDLYSKLSNYVHTKGIKYSSQKLNRSNINNFIEKSLLDYIASMEEMIKVAVILHLLKYPIGMQNTPIDDKYGLNGPIGGFLNPHQSERFKELLGVDVSKELMDISNSDSNIVSTAKYINDLPDISEDEFEEQCYEFDKVMSQHYAGGFEKWLENEQKILKAIKSEAEQEKMQQRINKIIGWAISEGIYRK